MRNFSGHPSELVLVRSRDHLRKFQRLDYCARKYVKQKVRGSPANVHGRGLEIQQEINNFLQIRFRKHEYCERIHCLSYSSIRLSEYTNISFVWAKEQFARGKKRFFFRVYIFAHQRKIQLQNSHIFERQDLIESRVKQNIPVAHFEWNIFLQRFFLQLERTRFIWRMQFLFLQVV